jgi:hypothetical protein
LDLLLGEGMRQKQGEFIRMKAYITNDGISC